MGNIEVWWWALVPETLELTGEVWMGLYDIARTLVGIKVSFFYL